MPEVIMFVESNNEKKVYECPDMPEAPEGSIFHRNFDISTMKIHKTFNGVEFLNPEDDEVAVVARIEKSAAEIKVFFDVTELAIRSFQIFKNIELSVHSSENLRLGLECDGKMVYCDL